MNRIVRDHYPVSNLPADLREGLDGQTDVRVTIEAGPDAPVERGTRQYTFSQFRHLQRANFASSDEVDAYVGSLRDEWTDRER